MKNQVIYKRVEGFEETYMIGSNGECINFRTGRTLKPQKVGEYLLVRLQHKGHIKQEYIHRLVADHFLPNPTVLPEVDHFDGDTHNNDISNLRWISLDDNRKHASQLLKFERDEVESVSGWLGEDIFEEPITIMKVTRG